jgi:hypothetical protein
MHHGGKVVGPWSCSIFTFVCTLSLRGWTKHLSKLNDGMGVNKIQRTNGITLDKDYMSFSSK